MEQEAFYKSFIDSVDGYGGPLLVTEYDYYRGFTDPTFYPSWDPTKDPDDQAGSTVKMPKEIRFFLDIEDESFEDAAHDAYFAWVDKEATNRGARAIERDLIH